MRFVKQFVAVVLVAAIGGQAVGGLEGHPWLVLMAGTLTAVVSLLVYRWVIRRTEHRDPVEAGGAGAGLALSRGLLIGAGMFAAVIGTIAVSGGYRITGWGSPSGAVGTLGFMAAAAVTEELIFRGVLFRIAEERIGTWWALMSSGLLFGLIHLVNPDGSLWGAVAVAVEAGGMLAAAYAATRTLWLPIGVHLAWNVSEAGIFGTQVSGTGGVQGLLDGVTSGSTLVSGGAFGPEASLAAVVAGVALTAVFLRLAHRRGNVVSRGRRGARPGPVGAGSVGTVAP